MTVKAEAEELEALIGDSLFVPDETFPMEEHGEEGIRGLDIVVMDVPERKKGVGIPKTETDIDDDYEYVRSTYQHIIDQGKETLKSVLDMAKTAPDPRTFEVANNLMKVIADNTDKLLKMQKDYKELKKVVGKESPQTADTINNTSIVYNGSLQDLLSELEESEGEIIDA